MGSVFGPVWLSDMRVLSKEQRARVASVVRTIEADPHPDGEHKRAAPSPFKSGTLVAIYVGLAVRYAIEADGLRFYRVQRVER
jgi:hypothetical protein